MNRVSSLTQKEFRESFYAARPNSFRFFSRIWLKSTSSGAKWSPFMTTKTRIFSWYRRSASSLGVTRKLSIGELDKDS